MEKKKVEMMICPEWEKCKKEKGTETPNHCEPHEKQNNCSTPYTIGEGGDCPPCTSYELQIGDRVLVMESMRGVIEERGWCSEMLEEVGSKRVVLSVSDNLGYHEKWAGLEGSYFSWPVDHLQYVGRGEKDITTTFVNCGVSSATGWPTPVDHGSPSPLVEPEYIATGWRLPLWELIKSSEIAMHELGNLVEWLTGRSDSGWFMRGDMFTINGFIDYALQYNCFKIFLLENGHIAVKEEEKKEVFYKIGQWVQSSGSGYKGMLAQTSSRRVKLIGEDGNRKNAGIKVCSTSNITTEELQEISCEYGATWTVV